MSDLTTNTLSGALDGTLDPAILTDALERLRIPGAAIAVQQGGQNAEIFSGLANVADAISVSTDTLFQIGSITKVFTATLACKLHEEGVIDLDAPLTNYLADFRVAGETPPTSLTVRSLLDYSSGIEGQYFADYGTGTDALQRYVEACNELRIIHSPGTMRSYNSTSHCIAGRLIEVVTGEFYDDALASRLLEPIGIHDYSFYDISNLSRHTALGHHWDDVSSGFAVDEHLRLPRSMSPAGSSLSLTASGLLAFARMHLSDGIAINGQRYLSAESVQAMRTSYRDVPPNNSELLLGWAAMPLGDARITIASGRTIGQNAFVLYCPEHDFAMSILSNCVMGGEQLFSGIGLDVIEILTGKRPCMPTPPEPPSKTFDFDAARYLGTYTNPTRVSVVEDEGELSLVAEYNDVATGDPVSYTCTMQASGEHTFALTLAGTDQIIGSAQFLFDDPTREKATQVFTSGCVFGRQ